MGCDHDSFTLAWWWHQLLSGSYPTAACPGFHIGCRLARELFTLPVCCSGSPWSHGLRASFIILEVWRWHQPLSNSLSNGYLSRISRRLGRELFRPSSYTWLSGTVNNMLVADSCWSANHDKYCSLSIFTVTTVIKVSVGEEMEDFREMVGILNVRW